MINSICVKSQSYLITPFDDGSFSVNDSYNGQEIILLDHQIKWGIDGESSRSEFIKLKRTQLAYFVYAPKNAPPTTLWVFQPINDVMNPKIAKVLYDILKLRDCQDKLTATCKYKRSLERIKILKELNPEVQPEIEKLFLAVKRDYFLAQMEYERELYLIEKQVKKQFNENINDYKHLDPQKVFECFLDITKAYYQVQKKEKKSNLEPYKCLTAAITHDFSDDPIASAKAYLQLLTEDLPNAFSCIEKIRTILDKTSDPYAFINVLEKIDRDLLICLLRTKEDPHLDKLLLQKDAIRMKFEKSLDKIKNHPDQQRPTPSCFICFALEDDVTHWLSKTFVPDLERVGIRPVFGPWHLSHSDSLNEFQSKIRNTDLALIICTPRLKDICENRLEKHTEGITGSAQEIRVVQERFNDKDKHNTITLVHLKGERIANIPTAILAPNFSTQFTILDESTKENVFSYYSKAFRLFACLKEFKDVKGNIPEDRSSKIANKLEQDFYSEVQEILKGNINEEEVKIWREELQRSKEII